jgi:uncharacterized phage protein (TIGR01671 family)
MIKLRAWIKPYKMMVEVQRINFDVQTIEVQIGEGDLYEFNFEEIELMRSTERKDKNGKEIYERDICKAYQKPMDSCANNNEVKFIRGCWRFVSSNKRMGDVPVWNYKKENIEVVGNKFQNPELLEVDDG